MQLQPQRQESEKTVARIAHRRDYQTYLQCLLVRSAGCDGAALYEHRHDDDERGDDEGRSEIRTARASLHVILQTRTMQTRFLPIFALLDERLDVQTTRVSRYTESASAALNTCVRRDLSDQTTYFRFTAAVVEVADCLRRPALACCLSSFSLIVSSYINT